MDKIEWWWTGRNNATDNSWRRGHRWGYWPPRGVGVICGIYYRIGWLFGKFFPNPREYS